MRKDIVTDNFMWDSKDKYKSSIIENHIIKYKFKTGDRYIDNINSILFKEYGEICESLRVKFNSLKIIFGNDDAKLNRSVSLELYESEKSNLVKIVDKVNECTGVRNIIVYPSHKLKKHLQYENKDIDLRIKFREGTSTSVNSDVMESIYQLHSESMFKGRSLKDKTDIFVDGLNYLNDKPIHNNDIYYKIYYKLEGYNTIMIGIENNFYNDFSGIEVYEESLVDLYKRRIFITPTETSKTISYYLDNNPTKDDLSIVRLILQDYNIRHQTKYKLHSSNRFVYIEDEDIDQLIVTSLSNLSMGKNLYGVVNQGKRFRLETRNLLVMSLNFK